MRIVFMGTPRLAVPILQRVASEHEVIAAYTRADSVSGRGGHTRPTPVRLAAEALEIPVRTPKTLRDPAQIAGLCELAPDAVVTAAFGLILPKGVLDAPKHCCLNAHASLLPRWRGAAPIQRAMLAGDTRTGVCVMRMDEGLDTGDVCMRGSVDIGDMDIEALTDELARLGASLVSTALSQIEEGIASWAPQGDDGATYASKITKSEMLLDPAADALANLRRVRASDASARARAKVCGKAVAITHARLGDALGAAGIGGGAPMTGAAHGALAAGQVAFVEDGVLLGCSEGSVLATGVRPEGKGGMDAASWARGLRGPEMAWEAL